MRTYRPVNSKRKPGKTSHSMNSVSALMILAVIVTVIIIGRLFYLQVVKYGFYQEVAARAHQGYTELPAKRGEILVKDYTTGDSYTVASNTTLNLIYVDPKLITNKTLVATMLSEILFDQNERREIDNQRVIAEKREFKRTGNMDAYDRVQSLSDEELKDAFYHEILGKVSRNIREKILLADNLPPEYLDEIAAQSINGIEVSGSSLLAYPQKVYDKRRTALALSDYLQIPAPRLEQILIGENRYEIIAQKVSPEKSKALHEIIQEDASLHPELPNYLGVGFQEEYYRYYPEGEFASNILGFVDKKGAGQYGIEESFDKQLKGRNGVFKAQRDSIGRQITVGESIIQPAVNGDSVVLTIDRTIQLTVEKILKDAVQRYRADSGQVIIMDPTTGKIIAMAHYPTFNPNSYGDAYKKVDVEFSEAELENLIPIEESDVNFNFYRNYDTDDKFEVFKNVVEGKDPVYQRYANMFGPAVYQNRVVSAIYEPGSVFKSIAMAAAIDDGDVTPNTTFYESGPVKVDEFEIKNSTNEYRGLQTMTNVLERSSNVGMAFVAKTMGRNLFYTYLIKFGFNAKTGIEFEYEQPGKVEYFTQWADSELVTRAFGQGIAVTPLQMTNAYCVLANRGVMMQPYIVDAIIDPNGHITETEPLIVSQTISEDTANKITAMLVSAVENGVANKAKIDGHYIAGKTGTSQTYKWGQPLTGPGTTITSFAGYGPIDDPRFVVLVKLDRPRASEWGADTAALVFKDIGTFLFDYYNIPPDK